LIDFEKALITLDNAQVRFVIVGGLAITIHGSAYVTFDLDFCYARDQKTFRASHRPYNHSIHDCAAHQSICRFALMKKLSAVA